MKWTIFGLILLTALWSLVWIAAYLYRDKAIQNLRARELAQGRDWTCVNPSSTGFPLRYRLNCESVSLKSTSGQTFDLKLGPVSVSYTWLQPFTATISAERGVSHNAQEQSIRAEWAAMTAHIHKSPIANIQVIASVRDLEIVMTKAGQPADPFAASHLNVRAELARGDQASALKLIGALDSDGVRFASLSRIAPGPGPLAFRTDLTVERLDQLLQGDPRLRLARWRDANGSLQFEKLEIRKQPTQIKGAGRITIDAANKPAGTIALETTGMPNVLMLLTGRQNQSNGGIASWFQKKPEADASPPARAFNAKIELRNGYVWVGPLRTPVALSALF